MQNHQQFYRLRKLIFPSALRSFLVFHPPPQHIRRHRGVLSYILNTSCLNIRALRLRAAPGSTKAVKDRLQCGRSYAFQSRSTGLRIDQVSILIA